MPQWVIASVFGVLALCAAWGIDSWYSTGTVYGELSQYSEDREPTAFFMIVIGKLLALVFCLALAPHAAGLLTMDPLAEIKQLLPWLPDHR
jgi:H+/Cl- antiporter ClcA